MKILFKDRKSGLIKVLADSYEDLWHLSNLITPGSVVEAKTIRTVKFGTKEEKKPVFLSLEVEAVKFSKLKKSLRISGKIISGKPEDFIQKGRYHTIELKEGDSVSIKKDWLINELKRLDKAVIESKRPKAYIVLVEENKVLVAKLLSYGIEVDEIYIHKSKKEGTSLTPEDFRILESLNKELLVIVAGPGFSKFKVADYLKSKGYNVIVENASYAEISGVIELIEKGIIKKLLDQNRLEEEATLMKEFEKHLFKEDGYAVYGKNEVEQAVSIGAVDKLFVLDELMLDEKFRSVIKSAEKTKAKIFVFSSTSPWGKKLSAYGGICAVLRFPIL